MTRNMQVVETCACGATFSTSGDSAVYVKDAADTWRDTHRHEVSVALPLLIGELQGEGEVRIAGEMQVERAVRIAADPESASDSDKLASLADWFDAYDAKQGYTGTAVQDFLRDLSKRLEG